MGCEKFFDVHLNCTPGPLFTFRFLNTPLGRLHEGLDALYRVLHISRQSNVSDRLIMAVVCSLARNLQVADVLFEYSTEEER